MFGLKNSDKCEKSMMCEKNLCDAVCPDSSRTLGIIHEFRRLYEEKMRIIDAEGSGDCNLQAKLSLQHDWIRDLNEQNEMLVRAVEELEQEATERVIALEDKLRQSSKCACEVMNGYKDLSNAFQHVDALQEDVVALVEFIRHSAFHQTWDTSGLKLRTVRMDTFMDDINSHYQNNYNKLLAEKMQEQLAKKDEDIKILKEKLECAIKCKEMIAAEMQKEKCDELRQSMLDMRDALTAEVADKHDVIITLKRDLQVLEEQCRKADQQTHFKDDIIKELRKQIKHMKLEVEERSISKIKHLENENDKLRDAIEKATLQLENLDETIAICTCGNRDLQKSCMESNQKISRLEADKLKLQALFTETQVQSAKKLNALEHLLSQYSANHDLQETYNDTIQRNYRLENEKLELEQRLSEFQAQSSEKIRSLEHLLTQYQAKAFTNQQQQTEQKIIKETGCCTDSTETINKGIDGSTVVIPVSCQTRIVCLNDSGTCFEPDVDTFSDCKSGSVTALRAEELKLEEVVHELQSSVSKMIVSECQIKQDKARIAELETQLSCAWRTKDCEVEAARTCREKEIFNLKQLIDTLVNNLENEKQRSHNLQRAVDSYHDTVDTIKESEDNFKQEVLGQKRTIQNLQEALVQTKQNLQDLQQKSNIECEEHSLLVEKLIIIVTKAEQEIQVYVDQCETFANIIDTLRDENFQLEENLFYNHQDLEMYEMRLAKYQVIYKQVEAQCGTLKKELHALEAQKIEKEAFVQDLSDNLSECQQELKQLFLVLSEEKLGKEDQTEQIIELQLQLHVVSEKLNNTLNNLEHQMEKNAKLSQSLAKSQSVTATIKNEALLAHNKLQEAAKKIANDEQRITAFGKQINEYQSIINLLQQDQSVLKKHLELAQLQLTNRCSECAKFTEQVSNLQKIHEEECCQLKNTITNLNNKVGQMEFDCKQHCQELDNTHCRVIDLESKESKVKQDLIDKETKFHTQINQYQSEQERLIMVVTSLEDQISRMNSQLNEKDHILETLKLNIAGQDNREIREKQEEIIRLKNEINSLIQNQVILKSDNEKLQMQVSHIRSSLESNDEKHKLIISELEVCLNDLQNDKEFMVRKNEQLIAQIQSLQELCNTKTETLVHLELELTETKFTRDSLCNESRQVIDHVKCWLEEQRKINLELNQRIKHKNDVIVKLKQEKRNLMGRFKQMSSNTCDPSGGTNLSSQKTNSTMSSGFGRQLPYSMQMIHSPPPQSQVFWSMGSVDSTPCSIIDDSDWEGGNSEDHCPQVWIQRVETLTEELQRSNRYWKTKMSDQEYSVSRDK